jgi:hypothetical protein
MTTGQPAESTTNRAPRPARTDVPAKARWLAARGRNALRHRTLVVSVGITMFVGLLVVLVLLPGSAPALRTGQILGEGMQDTLPLVEAYQVADKEYRVADSLLTLVRSRVAAPTEQLEVSLSPVQRWKVDSLTRITSMLSRLIARVENSPLPQTYRALGESSPLRADPRVQQLLDSLTAIERERDAFGAVGGVDPMFVALTSRATTIGRAIQGIAEAERVRARDMITGIQLDARDSAQRIVQARNDSIAASLRALAPRSRFDAPAGMADSASAAIAAAMPVLDTMPFRARADTAQVQRERAASALAVARTFNADLEKRAREAREQANTLAPPLAMLAAALVIGLVVAFAVAMLIEGARPAISDAAEAERIAGVRVLGTIRPDEKVDDRDRRMMDLAAPPDLYPGSRGLRAISLHLAAGHGTRTVTVVSDSPAISAAVASNLAFLASLESRNTLLVDTDIQTAGVSSVVHVRPAPGTAEVLLQEASWSEVITTPALGRDRLLDVVTAGNPRGRQVSAGRIGASRDEIERIARRYDFCVIAAPEELLRNPEMSVLPPGDVLLCAQVAKTSLDRLATMVGAASESKLKLRGIVLWDGDAPSIRPRDEQALLAAAPARATEDSDAALAAAR